jgi:acetoin utilization protein AcuB
MIIKEWMTRDVITVDPETSMMRAAKLMKEKGIRRLPVVDEKGKVLGMLSDRDVKDDKKISGIPVLNDANELVGIMTQNEVYRVLLSITGIYHGGIQLGLKLSDQRGTLKEVLDCLRGHKARVISVLTSYDNVEEGFRQVFIRIMDMDKSVLNELQKELGEKYELTFWVRDNIN